MLLSVIRLMKPNFGGPAVRKNLKELNPNPYRFWRRQQCLRFAWQRFGRTKKCFQLASRSVAKGMMYSTLSRKVKKIEQTKLWDTRINAATQEHGLDGRNFMEGLARCRIQLDRKMLSELAIYEPRTFQSLTEVSKKKLETEGISDPAVPIAKHIITKGLL